MKILIELLIKKNIKYKNNMTNKTPAIGLHKTFHCLNNEIIM